MGKRISQLEIYKPDAIYSSNEMAIKYLYDTYSEIRRFPVTEYVINDELQAIEKVRKIFANGNRPVIIEFKE